MGTGVPQQQQCHRQECAIKERGGSPRLVLVSSFIITHTHTHTPPPGCCLYDILIHIHTHTHTNTHTEEEEDGVVALQGLGHLVGTRREAGEAHSVSIIPSYIHIHTHTHTRILHGALSGCVSVCVWMGVLVVYVCVFVGGGRWMVVWLCVARLHSFVSARVCVCIYGCVNVSYQPSKQPSLYTHSHTYTHIHTHNSMLGLDAAGKTTILYRLQLGEDVHSIPTIG